VGAVSSLDRVPIRRHDRACFGYFSFSQLQAGAWHAFSEQSLAVAATSGWMMSLYSPTK